MGEFYVQHEGIVGEGGEVVRGPHGERDVALINLTRFSFADNVTICVSFGRQQLGVYLRV